jgi:TfoX/Sxy family transcriptional regulator of competence genes
VLRDLLMKAFKSDPNLAPIVIAFEQSNVVGSGRKFGSNGLEVSGKLFALFTQGTLVVKLPKDRVAALIASHVGEQFDPGHGRLMKEWLTIKSAKASWIDLAREAHDFVKGVRRTALRAR